MEHSGAEVGERVDGGLVEAVMRLKPLGDIGPLDLRSARKLLESNNPRLVELGKMVVDADSTYDLTERGARWQRAMEALDLQVSDEPTRERFKWGPGDVVDLDELFGKVVLSDEEVQIIDYKGRRYHLVKHDDEEGGYRLEILEAYDEKGRPLRGRGRKNLEGQKVEISRLKSRADKILEKYGHRVSEEIVLVPEGVQPRRNQNGEEVYDEEGWNGMVRERLASRMLVKFPGLEGISWGVLVFKIELVPQDVEEIERLKLAHWRIKDSIREVGEIWEGLDDENKVLKIDEGEVREVEFDAEEGVMKLVVYVREEELEVRREYWFDTKGGCGRKSFVRAGRDWVAVRLDNTDENGFEHWGSVPAARVLDEIRYEVMETRKSKAGK